LTSHDPRPRERAATNDIDDAAAHADQRAVGGPSSDRADRVSSDDRVGDQHKALDSPHGRPSDDGLGGGAPVADSSPGNLAEQELAELAEENANLRLAIDNRAVIEQAKGVLMLRYSLDQDAAFAVLRRWSQNSNIKVHAIAETLVKWAGCGDAQRADHPGGDEGLEEDLAALFAADPTHDKRAE